MLPIYFDNGMLLSQKKIILFATLFKSSRKEDKLRSQIRDTYEEVRFGLVEIQFTAFF